MNTPTRPNRRHAILVSFFLLAAARPGLGEEILSLAYDNEAVVDRAMGRPVEAEGLVIMGSGPAAYAELDGRTGIVVDPDESLRFGPGDTLWIAAWVEPAKFAGGGAILSKGPGSNYRFQIDRAGHLAFSYYSQGEWRGLVAPEPLDLNAWQHVACLFDGSGSIQLFVDGRLVARQDNAAPFQSRDDTPVYVGASPRAKSETGEFTGWVGALGPVVLAKGNPLDLPVDAEVGTKVFEPVSPF